MSKAEADKSRWSLYIVQTISGMLYTGISNDVAHRLCLHQSGKGAKALRGKGPLTLLFTQEAGDRARASQLEYQVKRLNRQKKIRLIATQPACLVEWLNQHS